MGIAKAVRRNMVNLRTKLTGESPFSRGKRKLVRVLNPQVSSFTSVLPPKMRSNVITRRAVNEMLQVAEGRPRIRARINDRLRQFSKDGINVKERGLGRAHYNPHMEFTVFEKLTSPSENIRKGQKRKA
jgi:hypothetical protein